MGAVFSMYPSLLNTYTIFYNKKIPDLLVRDFINSHIIECYSKEGPLYFLDKAISLRVIFALSVANKTFCPNKVLSAIFSNLTTSAPFFLACFTI